MKINVPIQVCKLIEMKELHEGLFVVAPKWNKDNCRSDDYGLYSVGRDSEKNFVFRLLGSSVCVSADAVCAGHAKFMTVWCSFLVISLQEKEE